MTYIWTLEGWLYLASVIDLFSRKGWHLAPRMTRELPLQAPKLAIHKRRSGEGLIHHSDRGSQYCSNAYMESFHATLKKELVYRRRFKTRAEAIRAINHYIHDYNTKQMHSSLDYWSPSQFEAMHLKNQAG